MDFADGFWSEAGRSMAELAIGIGSFAVIGTAFVITLYIKDRVKPKRFK